MIMCNQTVLDASKVPVSNNWYWIARENKIIWGKAITNAPILAFSKPFVFLNIYTYFPNLWRCSFFTIFCKEIDDIWKIFNLTAGKGQWKDKQIPFCVKRKIQNSELENPVGGRDTSNVIFAQPLLHNPVRYGTFFCWMIFFVGWILGLIHRFNE